MKEIDNICKKNPSWKKLFNYYFYNDNSISISKIEYTFNLIVKYKFLFNNLIIKAYEIEKDPKKTKSSIDTLYEYINNKINIHKKNKIIKELKDSKYQFLLNEKVENEIFDIINNNIEYKYIKRFLINKIAKYKSDIQFLDDLKNFKRKNTQWNIEYYKKIILEKKLNINILREKNGYFLIEAKDHKSCRELGSESWCIVQNTTDFFKYTE